jgi:hypothetical protein
MGASRLKRLPRVRDGHHLTWRLWGSTVRFRHVVRTPNLVNNIPERRPSHIIDVGLTIAFSRVGIV